MKLCEYLSPAFSCSLLWSQHRPVQRQESMLPLLSSNTRRLSRPMDCHPTRLHPVMGAAGGWDYYATSRTPGNARRAAGDQSNQHHWSDSPARQRLLANPRRRYSTRSTIPTCIIASARRSCRRVPGPMEASNLQHESPGTSAIAVSRTCVVSMRRAARSDGASAVSSKRSIGTGCGLASPQSMTV